MILIGSIIPTQQWEMFIFSTDLEAVIIDFSPLAPNLEDIQSVILLRRVFVINGLTVRDEHFKTLPKTDNEIIVFKPISTNIKLLILESFIEVCKVYYPKTQDYTEPNYLINLYGLP